MFVNNNLKKKLLWKKKKFEIYKMSFSEEKSAPHFPVKIDELPQNIRENR